MGQISETTNALLNGNYINLIITFSFVLVVILIFTVLAKKNIISFNSDHFKLGESENTREIIRRQMEFAQNAVQEFIELLSIEKGQDEYKIKYAAEKVYDAIVSWISINHIVDDEFYIQNKQIIVWNILQAIGNRPEFKTPEFRKSCDETVEKIIKQLVKIKQFYSKKS